LLAVSGTDQDSLYIEILSGFNVAELVSDKKSPGLIKGQTFSTFFKQTGLGFPAGAVALLGMQAIINMGVNMGALPTKGLTLPFVSYGGSSMVVSCLAAGLLLRIGREQGRHKVGAA